MGIIPKIKKKCSNIVNLIGYYGKEPGLAVADPAPYRMGMEASLMNEASRTYEIRIFVNGKILSLLLPWLTWRKLWYR